VKYVEKQMKSRLIGLLIVENSVEIVDNKVYNYKSPNRLQGNVRVEQKKSFLGFCQYSDGFSQRTLAFLKKEFYNRTDQQDYFPQGG
jgi:hypothetical protein